MGKIPIVPVTFIIDSYHSDEEIDGSRSGIRTYHIKYMSACRVHIIHLHVRLTARADCCCPFEGNLQREKRKTEDA